MSFLTSLSLSFNNLRTKKGRTLLTSFAGSIGIIGIALILALSTGVNDYITNIQKETMTSYPITISAQAFDMESMMDSAGGITQGLSAPTENRDGVYADNTLLEGEAALNSSITENNLTAFKDYLENPDSEIRQYIGENGIVYTYDVSFDVFAKDDDGVIGNTDRETDSSSMSSMNQSMRENMSSMMGVSSSGAENFEQLMPGPDGENVSPVVTESYDVLYGSWPQEYNQVVLVLDESNAIPTTVLYQLGFLTEDQFQSIQDQIEAGEDPEVPSWSYEDLCGRTFRLVPACDFYEDGEDGLFTYLGDNEAYTQQLFDNGLELEIVGVIRPKEDAANASLNANVAYTSALTDYLIDYTDESSIIQAPA